MYRRSGDGEAVLKNGNWKHVWAAWRTAIPIMHGVTNPNLSQQNIKPLYLSTFSQNQKFVKHFANLWLRLWSDRLNYYLLTYSELAIPSGEVEIETSNLIHGETELQSVISN